MQMKALFIGQSYIDITFVTDHMPSGDEKTVARDYAVSFGGNAVTMGAKGLLWYDESDAERFLPALDVPDRLVIDTNGAGDIFHGSYVYSYLIDPDAEWEQHFKFARAASAHSIQHLGNEASLPTLAQINETAARFGERRQTPVELGLVPERGKRATKPATVRR